MDLFECCKTCKRRKINSPGCHSGCEEYASASILSILTNAQKRNAQKQEADYISYATESYERRNNRRPFSKRCEL